jgi:peptidoglycan DL-endopeptidase LytE
MKQKVITLATATVVSAVLFQSSASAATIKVKPGDTLWGLSRQYQTTVEKIKSANGLTSDRIYIGQQLYIPEKTSVNSYTVKPGDSLWKIARQFNMSVSELKALNGLTRDLIYPNQVLKVAGKASSSSLNSSANANVKSQTVVNNSIVNSQKLVADAKALIGTPYSWGGSSPAGFDCSGFIYYVVNKQIKYPRLSTAGYWDKMTSVSSLQLGDIVFFTTTRPGPSHMGIYIGNGQFIHASSSKGVIISDMNNSYWKPRYIGAKRIVK